MVGLHNIDLISDKMADEWCEDIRWLKQRFPERRVILSIVGETREQWQFLVQRAEEAGADMVEASISCPQGTMLEGEEHVEGSMVSQDPRLTEKVTRWAVSASKKMPLYTKITSAVTNIGAIAKAVERGGAQAVCVIDSVEGIVGLDETTFAPLPTVQGAGTRGGFTGRAIKPIALRCIADVSEAVKIPISGVGGIYSWRDALEFLMMGASTIQVCTAVMQRGFRIIDDLNDGLARWLEHNGHHSPMEVIGISLHKLKDIESLEHHVKVISVINYDLCIQCGLCYVACRDGAHVAIHYEPARRRVAVDEERCVGCALCAQVCPVPGCITSKNIKSR
jgi:dihydropyrimidine dehydrogenase (NAD+) subunit PreA